MSVSRATPFSAILPDATDTPDRVLEHNARYDGGLVFLAMLEVLGAMVEEVIRGDARIAVKSWVYSAPNFCTKKA
jgi:hypothetical protein